MAHKNISLPDFLTDEEIIAAKGLYDLWRGTGQFCHKVVAQIIEPNLKRIEKDLGQQMDARYLGYAVEYVFMAAAKAQHQRMN